MTLPRNTLDQQIEAARQRLETLQQHAGESPELTALMMEALEELSNALEELHVAGEELREQNDELAASRQAVEAERQRYEELFEFAPDGYLVTNPEGVIQEANRAAAALLGVRQDFLAGKPLLVFVADVTVGHAAFHTRLTQLQKAHTDKLQDWQLWLQPREGGPFPVEVTVGRACDANNRLTGLRWSLRDITRRKRAEEALQLSEAHYRAIVEDQTEFILRFLPDGSLTFVNGAYCRYLGKTHEEMIDRSQVLLTPVADRKEIEQQLASLTPENPAATYEYRAALSGGQMGWQQWTTRALYDDEGNLVEYQSVGRDITERKRMEEALRESEARFRLALKHAPVTVAAQDRDLRFIWAYNQRTVRPADAIGKTDADVFTPEDAARLMALKRKVIETGADLREQLWLTRPGGRMFLDLYLEPMRDDAGQIIGVGIATVDLTERKRAEEEIAYLAKFPSENPQPVLRLSQAGVVLYANEASQALLHEWGCAVGDSVPSYWRDLVAEVVASLATRTVDIECGDRVYALAVTFIPEAGYVNLYGQDITERQQAEEALRQSEERFRAIAETTPVGVGVVAIPEATFLFVNSAYEKAFGYSKGELLGQKTPAIYWETADRDRILQILTASGDVADYEVKLKKKDGTPFWGMASARPITYGGKPALLGAFVDITDRKQAEEALYHLNRTLQAHSHSDRALMRATTETEYMQEVCKIIVEDCGHAMVWIGFAEEDEIKSIRPVAYAGFEEGYLETLHITWADTERGRGPTGTAVRTGKPSFCRNMFTDPLFTPWRAEALKRGYASSLVLPLLDQGRAFGALTIYFREPDPFTEDEINLLSGLADDLAYGIQTLRLRAAHAQAEAALRESEERAREQAARLQAVLDTAPAIIWIAHDRECRSITGNRASRELLRVSEGINISKSGPAPEVLAHYRVFKDGVDLASQDMPVQRVAASGRPLNNYALEIVFDDGAVRSLLGNVTPVFDSEGQPNGAIAVFVDITERKRVEEERERLLAENLQQRRLLETLFEADPDGLAVVTGEELVLQLANPAYQAFTPRPMENILGQSWNQVWAGAATPEVASAIRRLMVTGMPVDEESQERIYPDGHTGYFSFHARRLPWNAGYAVLTVLQETTAIEEARRRASDAAQEAQRRAAELDATITAIADGLMLFDQDAHVQRINPAAGKILGYKQGGPAMPLAGRLALLRVEMTAGTRLTQGDDTPVLRALRGETMQGLVMSVHIPDEGQKWLSTSAAPVQTADGRTVGAIISFTDITELRQTQQRLQVSNEELEKQTEELKVQTEELQALAQELIKARDELELRVQERTQALASSNYELEMVSERLREQNDELLTAHQMVEAERQRYHDLFEFAPDGYLVTGPDGIIQEANHAVTKLLDFSHDYLVGKPLDTFVAAQDQPAFGALLAWSQREFETGSSNWELRLQPRRRAPFDAELTFAPVRDARRELAGLRWLVRDISGRKQAEAALRLASAYNRSLIEASLDPLVTIGLDGKITDVNLATEAATGRSRAELVGTDFAECFSEPGLARAGYREVFRAGSVRDYALELLHRDGSVTSVLYNASVYRDEAGQVLGVFAAARDITVQKQAEERLRLQSAALEAAANGILIADRQGNIQWINPAFTQMTGYAANEALGQNPRLVQSGHHTPEFYRQLWETILAGQVWHGEMTNRRKDGSLYVEEQTIAPVRSERGELEYFIAIKQDVTQRRRAEDAERNQRQLAEGLVQATLALNSSLDLGEVLDRILEQIQRVIPYHSADIALLEGETVRVARHRGFENRLAANATLDTLHPLDAFPLFRAMSTTRQPVLVADTRSHADWQVVPGFEWAYSYVGAPLTVGEQVIGFISILNEQPGSFDEAAIEHLMAFATHAAIAIQNARLYQAELHARQIAETLSAANLALTQTLELEAVMKTLLDHMSQLVPYDSANVMLLESESRLVVKVIRGYERWTDPAQTRALAFDTQTNPLFQELLSTQKSILIPDTRLYPGWETRPGAEHVRNWLGVPLAAGGQVIGVYSLDKVEPYFFTAEHIRLAEALVGQAAVAIQNAWLFDQIRAGRERLQSLSRRLVEVQEAERRYIARELHDEVGQALTSLMFGLGRLEQPADPSEQSTRIAELKQMTNAISESLHQLAMDLRPASLDHLGLVPALQQYVQVVGDRYGLIAQFKALGVEGVRLLPAMETALYRIVQEALTNVVRHARATRVDVLLERRGDKVILVVEDNGVGFDADAARSAQSGRLGVLGMQERAEMLGGSLVIESAAGAGTTMVVEVPYADSYPHR